MRRVVNEHNAEVEDASIAALAAEYSQKAEAYARLWSPVIKPMVALLLQALPLASAQRILEPAIFRVFHLPDPLKGLAELRRVVKPGGALGIATWGMDPGQPGLAFWTRELDRAGAPPDPRDPSVNQRDLMNTPDKLQMLVSNAGFRSARIWSTVCAHRWTVDGLMSNQTSCGAPMRRLEQLPPDVRLPATPTCAATSRRSPRTS